MRRAIIRLFVVLLPMGFTAVVKAQTPADMEALGKEAAQGSHAAIDELEKVADRVYENINYQAEQARASSNRVLMTAAFAPLADEVGEGSYTALETLKYANGKQRLRTFTVDAFGRAALWATEMPWRCCSITRRTGFFFHPQSLRFNTPQRRTSPKQWTFWYR